MTDLDDNAEFDLGTAGASARREHARRTASRQDRVRGKHPRIGGLLLALNDEPSHETAWARGAGGEERVAKALSKYLTSDIKVMHDRRIPPGRTNIDHIAVAASGVWVIDSKRYKGKVAVRKPILGPARLTIAGRDKSTLADGLEKQVALVQAVIKEIAPEVPVHGVMCFVDADLPVTPEDAPVVLAALAARFPPA